MKTLLTVAFVAAAVAAPYLVPELMVGASALAIAAATAAAEVGIALASSALIGPAVPKGLGTAIANNQRRLFVSYDTTAPRKIVFGKTAGADEIRYA